MKKIVAALIFGFVASSGFSFEFSPFVWRIINAGPQRLVDMVETTGRGTFSQELTYLVHSLAYGNPYFYSYDRLDPQSMRALTDYFAQRNVSGEDRRWIWDKIWNVLVIGSGLIYDQNISAYESDIHRLYELAYRPVDIRKSRYENDLIGFARLIVQPLYNRRSWLSPASSIPAQPVYAPPSPPVYSSPAPFIPVTVPARFIPQMPDPYTNRVYRIQVGSYVGADAAYETASRLRWVGFFPAYEINGGYYRVVITGVPATSLPAAAQLLGLAGFMEAWIREEW
jgi:hypothetical protein